MRKNYVDTNPGKSGQGLFTMKQLETGKSETVGSSQPQSAAEMQLDRNVCMEKCRHGKTFHFLTFWPLSLRRWVTLYEHTSFCAEEFFEKREVIILSLPLAPVFVTRAESTSSQCDAPLCFFPHCWRWQKADGSKSRGTQDRESGIFHLSVR